MAHSECSPVLVASCSLCAPGAGGTGTTRRQLPLTATDSEEKQRKALGCLFTYLLVSEASV